MHVAKDKLLKCQNVTIQNLLIQCCELLSLLNILNLTSMHDETLCIGLSLLQMLNLAYITSNGWVVTQHYSSTACHLLAGILLFYSIRHFTVEDLCSASDFCNMMFGTIVNYNALYLLRH